MADKNLVYAATRIDAATNERLKQRAESNERTVAAELRLIIKKALQSD